MNQQEFETYLEQQPKLSGTEAVGRFVTNAFGTQEKVVLPHTYWRYVDWLVTDDGVDIAKYIVDCDKDRGQVTLSENLMYWLYSDMTERKQTFQPLPNFLSFL